MVVPSRANETHPLRVLGPGRCPPPAARPRAAAGGASGGSGVGSEPREEASAPSRQVLGGSGDPHALDTEHPDPGAGQHWAPLHQVSEREWCMAASVCLHLPRLSGTRYRNSLFLTTCLASDLQHGIRGLPWPQSRAHGDPLDPGGVHVAIHTTGGGRPAGCGERWGQAAQGARSPDSDGCAIGTNSFTAEPTTRLASWFLDKRGPSPDSHQVTVPLRGASLPTAVSARGEVPGESGTDRDRATRSPRGAGRTSAVTPSPHARAVGGHDRMAVMAIPITTVTELVRVLVIAFVHSLLTEVRSWLTLKC